MMEQKVVILGGGDAWAKECCRGSWFSRGLADRRAGGVPVYTYFAFVESGQRWVLRKEGLSYIII